MEASKLVTSNNANDWTLIKQTASQFISEEDDSFQFVAIMIAALFEGPNEERIARVTGYSPEFISQIGTRLKESGLWTNEKTDYQVWDDTTEGLIRFIMDVEVAKGTAFRAGDKRNGEYVYRITELGETAAMALSHGRREDLS